MNFEELQKTLGFFSQFDPKTFKNRCFCLELILKFQKKPSVFLRFSIKIQKNLEFSQFQKIHQSPQIFLEFWKTQAFDFYGIYFGILKFWKTRGFGVISHMDGWLFIWIQNVGSRSHSWFFERSSMPSQLYGWPTDASKHRHSGFAEGGAIFSCLPSLVGTTVLEMTTSTTLQI